MNPVVPVVGSSAESRYASAHHPSARVLFEPPREVEGPPCGAGQGQGSTGFSWCRQITRRAALNSSGALRDLLTSHIHAGPVRFALAVSSLREVTVLACGNYQRICRNLPAIGGGESCDCPFRRLCRSRGKSASVCRHILR